MDIDEKDRHYLLILVHGFNSSSTEAWGDFPKLVADAKSTDFSDFNVMRYGYGSHACRNKVEISERGEGLASYLKTIFGRYKGIIIAGHSMGGLVIMHALEKLATERDQTLLGVPISVLTFGTPYFGVEGAGLARDVGLFCHDLQADGMRLFGSPLRDLRVRWSNLFGSDASGYRVSIHTYYAPEDTFVSHDSACGEFAGCEQVDGNHATMVKPTNTAHLSYIKLVQQVKAMRESSLANGEGCSRGLRISSLRSDDRLRALPGYPVKNKKEDKIFTGGFRASFSISHAGVTERPIKLIGLRLIVEEYQASKDPTLAYKVDLDKIFGKGTAEALSFQASLRGTVVKSTWITKDLRPETPKSENFFDIEPPRVLTFLPHNDAGEEIDVKVTATQVGLYKTKFIFQCSAEGEDSKTSSDPIYVYLQ
jgi:hypothetical protein